jgi:hypothetical protein
VSGVPPKKRGPQGGQDAVETVSLKDAVTHTLEEARMLLPGMHALFGFQLVAVFSERFDTTLSPVQQAVHLVALLLSGIAIALAMAPAAYHRQTEQGQVSAHFLRVASGFISVALWPLAVALSLDIYLVALVVTRNEGWSTAVTGVLAAVLVGLWFVLPRVKRASTRRR